VDGAPRARAANRHEGGGIARRLRPDAALGWGTSTVLMHIYPKITLSHGIGYLARFAIAGATAGFVFSSA